jgi:hypothetical protein
MYKPLYCMRLHSSVRVPNPGGDWLSGFRHIRLNPGEVAWTQPGGGAHGSPSRI